MFETSLIQSQHLSISQPVFRSVAMSQTAYMQKTSGHLSAGFLKCCHIWNGIHKKHLSTPHPVFSSGAISETQHTSEHISQSSEKLQRYRKHPCISQPVFQRVATFETHRKYPSIFQLVFWSVGLPYQVIVLDIFQTDIYHIITALAHWIRSDSHDHRDILHPHPPPPHPSTHKHTVYHTLQALLSGTFLQRMS